MIVKTVTCVFVEKEGGNISTPTTTTTIRFFGVLIFKKVTTHPKGYHQEEGFIFPL